MTEELIDGNYPLKDNVSLDYVEEGIRATEDNVEFGTALIAVAFGRIKKDQLYKEAGFSNFKEYLESERTYTKYKKAMYLSKAGINWWIYRDQFKENGLRLSNCLSKTALIDVSVVEDDPMFWHNFKSKSVRELALYIKKKSENRNVYHTVSNKNDASVKGASLTIGGKKVRGINIHECRHEIERGKRAVVIWVDDDNEARRIKRRIDR